MIWLTISIIKGFPYYTLFVYIYDKYNLTVGIQFELLRYSKISNIFKINHEIEKKNNISSSLSILTTNKEQEKINFTNFLISPSNKLNKVNNLSVDEDDDKDNKFDQDDDIDNDNNNERTPLLNNNDSLILKNDIIDNNINSEINNSISDDSLDEISSGDEEIIEEDDNKNNSIIINNKHIDENINNYDHNSIMNINNNNMHHSHKKDSNETVYLKLSSRPLTLSMIFSSYSIYWSYFIFHSGQFIDIIKSFLFGNFY
jgi:hypothetical protein